MPDVQCYIEMFLCPLDLSTYFFKSLHYGDCTENSNIFVAVIEYCIQYNVKGKVKMGNSIKNIRNIYIEPNC